MYVLSKLRAEARIDSDPYTHFTSDEIIRNILYYVYSLGSRFFPPTPFNTEKFKLTRPASQIKIPNARIILVHFLYIPFTECRYLVKFCVENLFSNERKCLRLVQKGPFLFFRSSSSAKTYKKYS